ncbi:MAG: hypothetical protein ABG776_11705, partial [Cyanobacteria bacterium J06555_13]
PSRTLLPLPPKSLSLPEPYRPEQEYDEYMRLGFASHQSGEYADAANFFRYALYAVPRDREATVAYWNAINELQSSNQDLTGRAAIYEANMEAGYDATEVSDYDAAMVYFRTALQQRPNDYYATQAIRNVHTYLNRGVNADSPSDVPLTYNVYAGETPYDRYMRLGYAAVQREDLAASITYFRSALYERKNDRQATIAYWNAVDGLRDGEFGLDTNPESVFDRYMRLGYDATTRNDYAQAVNFFERALAERPGDGYATQAIRNVRSYME